MDCKAVQYFGGVNTAHVGQHYRLSRSTVATIHPEQTEKSHTNLSMSYLSMHVHTPSGKTCVDCSLVESELSEGTGASMKADIG